ncbi:Pectinesterase protein [Dioscorea alata]|uniref:Pectinesterase protein n=1 Tax=Dioscorea alata TaxID=55571 RepID=A0ACB7W7N9_DIOAL|nr:Pectinesterase protein [Dioscorea alata]
MAPKSSAIGPLLLLLLLLAASVSALTLVSGSDGDSLAFIKKSCDSTLYPDLCFSSLSRYAASVHSDPIRLAWLATNVTIGRLRYISSHISSVRRTAVVGEGGREAAALKDCAETMGDAVDLARSSASEIGKLTAPSTVGTEIAWRVSNAQTWMSAVMTNEDTCTDGFAAVPGRLKTDICGRIRWAHKYTSNALALLNKLVSNR